MPRTKEPKVDPDGIYVCWMSGSAQVDGQDVSFSHGERLRGDSPAVQACPQFFVPDGTPTRELPTPWDAVVARTEAERPAPEYELPLNQEPVPLQREDVLQLARAITVGIGAGDAKKIVTYEKGTCFSARSEFCTAHPEAFEPAELQFARKV